jgi:hypothetical protein
MPWGNVVLLLVRGLGGLALGLGGLMVTLAVLLLAPLWVFAMGCPIRSLLPPGALWLHEVTVFHLSLAQIVADLPLMAPTLLGEAGTAWMVLALLFFCGAALALLLTSFVALCAPPERKCHGH